MLDAEWLAMEWIARETPEVAGTRQPGNVRVAAAVDGDAVRDRVLVRAEEGRVDERAAGAVQLGQKPSAADPAPVVAPVGAARGREVRRARCSRST